MGGQILQDIWCKDMEIWTCERSRLVHCDWNSSNGEVEEMESGGGQI